MTCAANSIEPLYAWLTIRNVLRHELGEREWELWIRHARLTRYSQARGRYRASILICMPRNGRAIFGAQRWLKKMRTLAHKLRYELSVTVQPDEDQVGLARERFGIDWTYLEPAPSELWGDRMDTYEIVVFKWLQLQAEPKTYVEINRGLPNVSFLETILFSLKRKGHITNGPMRGLSETWIVNLHPLAEVA